MAITIDVQYKGQITSTTVNNKFDLLYGGSGIVQGMDARVGTGLQVILGVGHYVIGGVSIYENAENTITLASSAPGVNTTYYVYVTYSHALAQVVYGVTTNLADLSNIQTIKLAQIYVSAGQNTVLLSNITKGPVLMTIQSLTDLYNKVNPYTANDDTSSDSVKNKLVSNAQMQKLAGIATGATNYQHPTYGTFTPTEDDTQPLTFFVGLTVNSYGHMTGAVKKAIVKSDITGLGIPAQDTTYNANDDTSTDTTKNKLVSNAQMKRLASIADGANNYSLPMASGSVMGGVKVGSRLTIDGSGILSVSGLQISDVSNLSTTISGLATQSWVTSQISSMSGGLVWQTPITGTGVSSGDTSSISAAYPTPDDGWVVSVTSTGNTYRYDGKTSHAWVLFNLVNIPLSSVSVNGLMSSSQFNALAALSNGGLLLSTGTYHTHSWDQISSGVPTTFTPAPHTHTDPDVHTVNAVYA